MGTISQIMRAIFLQEQGFNVQFVLGDLDSYNARSQPYPVVKARAKQYKEFINNLGFSEKKEFYVHKTITPKSAEPLI